MGKGEFGSRQADGIRKYARLQEEAGREQMSATVFIEDLVAVIKAMVRPRRRHG